MSILVSEVGFDLNVGSISLYTSTYMVYMYVVDPENQCVSLFIIY